MNILASLGLLALIVWGYLNEDKLIQFEESIEDFLMGGGNK